MDLGSTLTASPAVPRLSAEPVTKSGESVTVVAKKSAPAPNTGTANLVIEPIAGPSLVPAIPPAASQVSFCIT